MNVLLTGGAGFIGSHLASRLIQAGCMVTVIDNLSDFYSPALKRANIESINSSRLKFFHDDILDSQSLDKAFYSAAPDVVVHLAARAGIRPSLKDPELYNDVNVRGTLNVLEMCRRYSANLIFASSSSVYGAQSLLPYKEDGLVLSPLSPYAATKLACEAFIHSYSECYQLRATVLRFFTVYGPRQRPDLAIYKFTKSILDGEPITLYGFGYTARDYTWIDDIVDGVVASLEKTSGESYSVFNLGSSISTDLRTLVSLIEQSLGRSAILRFADSALGDVTATAADISKAERELGYSPKVTIREGINRFTNWYLASRSDLG